MSSRGHCEKAGCSMSDTKCAQMLLSASERDVEALRVMRDPATTSDEVFGFHVQQAAEKALKARIALLGDVYPLTHDIEELLDRLAHRGSATEPFQALVSYTPYAVAFRYAGVESGTATIDREGALAVIEALLTVVQGELAKAESD